MPIYDRACACGWRRDDCYEQRRDTLACPSCGAQTERLVGMPTIIGDEYTVPVVDDVMGRGTYVFRTKSEHRAAAKRHGVHIMEKGEGTDNGRLITPRQDREKMLVAWHKHQRGVM